MATKEELIKRLAQVRGQLDGWRVDGVVITNPVNRRWLSGFTGSYGFLFVTRDSAVIATDFRYYEKAQAQAPCFTLHKLTTKKRTLRHFIKSQVANPLGLEASHITLADMQELKRIKRVKFRKLEETVEPFRMVKSASELAAIRAAAQITDSAMGRVAGLARLGMTELELAWELEKQMREGGGHGLAFDVMVASGPNAASPHHQPGDRALQAGDSVIIDMGASIDGYKSDLTRSFFMGSEPSEQYQQVYELVAQAQLAALNGLKAGMTGKAVDSLARDYIASAGHGEHFGHGLGHSLGLEIHEYPRFSQVSKKDVVPAGCVMTVEPGIYIPEWGGVRIEDLVLVTEDGFEYLSHCPKEPYIAIS